MDCPGCGATLPPTTDPTLRETDCPECGETFERHELTWEVLAGDWTVLRGMRRAMGMLFVRSVLAAALWSALLWGLAAGVNAMQARVSVWTASALRVCCILMTSVCIRYLLS